MQRKQNLAGALGIQKENWGQPCIFQSFNLEMNRGVPGTNPASGQRGDSNLGPVSRKSRNLPGPVSIFLNVCFADYTVITDMVLGQCVYRIIRF